MNRGDVVGEHVSPTPPIPAESHQASREVVSSLAH